MTTFARAQENVVDPGAGGIRWFKAYEAVAEFSRGLAYLCKWESANNKWVVDEISGRQYIYSTVSGITAAANQFVPCVWNTRGRFWELLSVPEYGRIGEAYAPGGAVSTDSQTQQNFSEVTGGNELAFAADDLFEVVSGELNVLYGGVFFLTLNAYFTIKHTIDQRTRLDVYLQRKPAGFGGWQYTRLVVWHESNFPNVAVGANKFTSAVQWATYNGVPLSKDDRLRIVTEGLLSSGSWPSNTSVSPIYLQYAKVWRAEPPAGTVY